MKKNYIFGAIITLILFLIGNVSASHYIIGSVENALDSTPADNHTIMLWNFYNGEDDHLSDIIGIFGNSNQENNYSIDCELLNPPCITGDILTLKIIDNGDGYVSKETNVSVSFNSESVVERITLNSPPEVSLVFPQDSSFLNYNVIEFNCSLKDLDENLEEVSIYGNWSGVWELNETKEVLFGERFKTFTKTLTEGFYKYSCQVVDSLKIPKFSSVNNSFGIDLSEPIIESIHLNITHSCEEIDSVGAVCKAYDSFSGINKVTIQSISPSGEIINYASLEITSREYYSDIILNETGDWLFNCIAEDNAGNINNVYSTPLYAYPNFAELSIRGEDISLDNPNPLEGEEVNLSVFIKNDGCLSAENILISFFEEDPENSGEEIGNVVVNMSAISNLSIKIPWHAKIGKSKIFVIVDYTELISEKNKLNNKGNKEISVNAWQEIYGNITLDKIIGGEEIDMKKWYNESKIEGHIFITDSESDINWMMLESIGRSKLGEESSNDFLEIDNLLKMDDFEDSISKLFSNSQIPKNTKDMVIYQREIKNVPVIESTEGSSFVTGILWDSSDDGGNNEFDETDKEDVIFVTEVNRVSEGAYGIYDYEIKIPSRLREYYLTESEKVYLYYDLN